MDLANLRDNRRELDVDFGDGEVLHMAYRPNVITPAWLSEHLTVSTFLSAVVCEWDLTDGGDVVELTTDAIAEHVPYPLQYVIQQEIMNDLNPKARRRRSGGGSHSMG